MKVDDLTMEVDDLTMERDVAIRLLYGILVP